MRLLLDTHALLWAGGISTSLPKRVAEILVDLENQLFVSSVTVWEIAAKHALGKLPLPMEPSAWLQRVEDALGTVRLSFDADHALQVRTLPLYHRDPFDRMLICQAKVEGMTLLTADDLIRQYDVPTLW